MSRPRAWRERSRAKAAPEVVCAAAPVYACECPVWRTICHRRDCWEADACMAAKETPDAR